jgi:membrane protein YdbS with pleckstrin-like domain
MKSFISSHLSNNEEMVLEARKHWLALIPAFIYLLIFIAIIVNVSNIIAFLPNHNALRIAVKVVLYVIALIFIYEMFSDVIIFFTTELCFTDQRLIGKVGLFKVRVLLTPLNKINHVASTNGLLGSFLRYGNIHIHTSSGQVIYEQIDRHLEFINALMVQILIYEIYEREVYAGDSPYETPPRPPVKFPRTERVETKPIVNPSRDQAKASPQPQIKLGPSKSDFNLEKSPPARDDLLTVTCSKCNSVYSYKEDQAGQSTVCKKCGEPITVPK